MAFTDWLLFVYGVGPLPVDIEDIDTEHFLAWLVEEVMKSAAELIATAIENAVAELRYWKMRFFEVLADWLGEDLGWLLAVGLTIGLAILFPKIKAFISGSAISAAYKGIIESIRTGIAKVSELIHLVDLDAINKVLRVVWPEWREASNRINDAISAMSEELGQGTAYIHAYFSVVHGLAMVGSSFTGFPVEAAELRAFEDTDKQLRRIHDRFREYAHDPSKIVRDIIEEIYIPYATEISGYQQGTLTEIEASKAMISDFNISLGALDGALEHFIAIQPDAMSAVITERLGPFAELISGLHDDITITILPMLTGLSDAVEARDKYQYEINKEVLSKLADPYAMLAQGELYGEKDRQALEDYVAKLKNQADKRALDESIGGLDGVADAMIASTESYYFEDLTVEQPARPALSLEFPSISPTNVFPSWYRGED